jgi:hypothetical protein
MQQKKRPPCSANSRQPLHPSQDDSNQQALFGQPILDRFYAYLPPKPYCTDTLGYLHIRPKAQAVRAAYIQPNPITRAYWMVFDIDSAASRYWPDEWHIPMPNLELRNPENNHQHVYYLIDPAVYTLRQARRKPLELAADVDRCLTRLLEADPGYGKLIAKNPLSATWPSILWHDKAWGLTELLDFIPDKIRKWNPPQRDTIGLGRNCTVFDTARQFAYAEWRRLRFREPERLFERVYDHAMDLNLGFRVPMLSQEVRSIARSISKWTARHMDAAGLRAWGQPGREHSILSRQAKAANRAEEIRAYKAAHPEATVRELARLFECSIGSVSQYLNRW